MDILNQLVWGNSVSTWLLAGLIFILSFLGYKIIEFIILDRLKRRAERGETEIADLFYALVKSTRFSFLMVIALYFASLSLRLPDIVTNIFDKLVIAVLILQITFWSLELIDYLIKLRMEAADDDTALNAIRMLSKIAIWILTAFLLLENVTGIEATSLLAALGVGGIAVALAIQNVLGDLFSSLSISLDKPFAIGDSIAINGLGGTVESIGLKSTRIHSNTGEQLIFSNSDLLSSRIHNFERMERRRVNFKLGVASDTPYEKLASIPTILEEIVTEKENTSFARAHFTTYGDFALIFDCVYFMDVPDFGAYSETLHSINMEIFKRFEEQNIVMPYPTQTVLLEKS